MIFVDESIQRDHDYICVGFAYCEELPDASVRAALVEAGLAPGADEYKSGKRMAGSEPLHHLRERVGRIVLAECRLGVYIAPLSERESLLSPIIEVADLIVQRNTLPKPQKLFVDEGISGLDQRIDKSHLDVVRNCDSKQVLGIQLADYVAYHLSYLLKSTMTGVSKQVPIQTPGHPLEDQDVDFDWLLRTDFRRHFFAEPKNIQEIEGDDWFFTIAGYGAFYSSKLSEPVLAAAKQTFDSMYLGCVW
ncbi:MAG: DUF3800 domain-containing protein [Rhizobacter sp.]|nr:DUF3800 domain-containing protein [Rhizobacter sp.]